MARASLKSVTEPGGFQAAGGRFGIKASGRPDLALIAADVVCSAAAVFTTNRICSEPVILGKKHLKRGRLRAIVCNSGCANASTGKKGLKNAQDMCRRVAGHLGCGVDEVLACSTGVIGHHLPMEKIFSGIDELAGRLKSGPAADSEAAHAIMTTDLVPKAAVRRVKVGGKTVTLAGICKGSGMIAPDMATMLAFLTTDAKISPALLRRSLTAAVNADASFNRISVDTDTSPSDTVAILASGHSGVQIKSAGATWKLWQQALTDLCRDLAYQIIRDGEGVTRVMRVVVEQARHAKDALLVARTVADSPLLKCAVHGGDPNWGRLTAAAGRSGAQVAASSLEVRIGGLAVYRAGHPVGADLKKLEKLMKAPEVVFTLRLGQGKSRCEFLGCDLSHNYVTINADYHT